MYMMQIGGGGGLEGKGKKLAIRIHVGRFTTCPRSPEYGGRLGDNAVTLWTVLKETLFTGDHVEQWGDVYGESLWHEEPANRHEDKKIKPTV